MHLTKQALAQYLQIYIQNKNWWLKSYHMVKGKWSVIIIMKVRCHHIYKLQGIMKNKKISQERTASC